jgi:hypothetical protein
MKNAAITRAGMTPCRSPSVEQALRELALTAVTEACVSGLCDLCPCQADPCKLVGQQWADSHLPSLLGKEKNQKGAKP